MISKMAAMVAILKSSVVICYQILYQIVEQKFGRGGGGGVGVGGGNMKI